MFLLRSCNSVNTKKPSIQQKMWAMKSMCKTEVSSRESIQKTQWAATSGDKKRKNKKNKKQYLQKKGGPAGVRVKFRVPDRGRQHVQQEESPQNKVPGVPALCRHLPPTDQKQPQKKNSSSLRRSKTKASRSLRRTGNNKTAKSSSPIYTSASTLYTCNRSVLCSQGSMFPRFTW